MGTSTPPPGSGDTPGVPRYESLPRYDAGAPDAESPDPRVPGPLGVTDTVRAAVGLYGADAVKLWQVIAMVIIPVQVLVFVLRAISVPSGSVLRNSKIYIQPGASDGGFVALSALGELLAVLALLFSVGAAYRILLGRHLHHPAGLSESFSFARDRWLPLLGVSILFAVAVIVGFILIIIPGIYLLVALGLAVPVLMAEDRRGLQALGRSRELVAGEWWHVLGCILVAGIVAGIGQILISVIGSAVASGVHSLTGYLAINAIVSVLVSILFYPFTAAVPVVIYVDMLVRKRDPQLERLLA
jgi:hypothetical protein